jgi:hypothetical protein
LASSRLIEFPRICLNNTIITQMVTFSNIPTGKPGKKPGIFARLWMTIRPPGQRRIGEGLIGVGLGPITLPPLSHPELAVFTPVYFDLGRGRVGDRLPTSELPHLGSASIPKESKFPARWAQETSYIKATVLPKGVQGQIERLSAATLKEVGGTMHEHLGITIALADGQTITLLESTDHKAFSVGPPDNAPALVKEALVKARKIAAQKAGVIDGTIRIYSIHTHPEVDNMYIKREGDEYYTALSRDDYVFSELPFFHNLVRRIRAAGFTGPIEIVNGAVPVPKTPLEGDVCESLLITAYTQRIGAAPKDLAEAA